MKKGPKIVIIVAVVLAVAGAGVYLLRGKLFPSAAKANGGATSYTMYTAAMGDLSVTVAVSGTVEPLAYTTVRPDSNMPTRKLVRLLVKEGDTV